MEALDASQAKKPKDRSAKGLEEVCRDGHEA